jgi:hypothetical protein
LNIPCNECLKYPICISKRQVFCDGMIQFYLDNMDNSLYRFPTELWSNLQEMLPNALSICAEQKQHSITISRNVPVAWYEHDVYGVRKL